MYYNMQSLKKQHINIQRRISREIFKELLSPQGKNYIKIAVNTIIDEIHFIEAALYFKVSRGM
jgi:hypothetical protein